MTNKHKGMLSTRTKQEKYYDGTGDWYNEDLVSEEFKVEYILQESYEQEKYNTYDDEILWLKNEAQKKYYREPYKPLASKVEV